MNFVSHGEVKRDYLPPSKGLALRTIVRTYTRNMERLTSAQLANEGGVNVETIRYYERRGLLLKPPRTPSGYLLTRASERFVHSKTQSQSDLKRAWPSELKCRSQPAARSTAPEHQIQHRG